MRHDAPPSHCSCKWSHFDFSFRVEIQNHRLLAPPTANQPTSTTNPEHKSAVANNTAAVRFSVPGRFNNVLTSTLEKPNAVTRTTSATRTSSGKLVCDIRTTGRRLNAPAATIAAAATNKTLQSGLAPCRDSIPAGCVLFSMEPP